MVAGVITDGEFRSGTEGARGVAPADGCSTAAHLVLRDECLLRLFTKPSRIIGNVLFLSPTPTIKYPLLISIYYWNSNCADTLFKIRTSSHTILTMDRE
jgi:hypothetical protein